MNTSNILIYIFLAILLIYIVNKIKNNLNENFKEKYGNMDEDLITHTKNKYCTSCHNDTDADTYIRERLISGKKPCDSVKKYSNNELTNYRDKHFSFRNKIWQTSRDVDMVDKINNLYLSGDEDVAKEFKGKNISDLFNTLTKNDDLISQDCLISTNKDIERITKESGYLEKGHNGNMYSNANWKYENEKVLNGGNFFNNIQPFDTQYGINQAL